MEKLLWQDNSSQFRCPLESGYVACKIESENIVRNNCRIIHVRGNIAFQDTRGTRIQ